METSQTMPVPPKTADEIEWVEVVSTALLAGVFHVLRHLADAESRRRRRDVASASTHRPVVDGAHTHNPEGERGESVPVDPFEIDDEAADAAALLGVSFDATEDEIRAALRAQLVSSRVHPDQGGDAEEAK